MWRLWCISERFCTRMGSLGIGRSEGVLVTVDVADSFLVCRKTIRLPRLSRTRLNVTPRTCNCSARSPISLDNLEGLSGISSVTSSRALYRSVPLPSQLPSPTTASSNVLVILISGTTFVAVLLARGFLLCQMSGRMPRDNHWMREYGSQGLRVAVVFR